MPASRSPDMHLTILKRELLRRREKNRAYSARAFARQLGVHVSALSRILNGKQQMSIKAGISIVNKLDLPEPERREFLMSLGAQKLWLSIVGPLSR